MRAVGGRGSGKFEETTWDEAMDQVLGQLRQWRGTRDAEGVVLATEPLSGHLGMAAASTVWSMGSN
jgi:anaerobic selenocysteine-containing dehydrogenase